MDEMDAQRVSQCLIENHGDEPEAQGCSTKAYVTLQEKSILAALRDLREQAIEVRNRLAQASDPKQQKSMQIELEALRKRRQELVASRERAYRDKMIMLGHLAPDDKIELL